VKEEAKNLTKSAERFFARRRLGLASPATTLSVRIWQSGFETGGHVQRKLRLVFTVAAHHPV
jgi:hypothetical protein